jgi:stearoyl-CoA desaturase (delta-9 desaturase)
MALCLLFFFFHWQISVFFQSFFLHRYGAHRQYTMSKGWERVFHVLTWLTQGSSFLSPRGYAILHRMHHAFSDTDKDPHSPHNSRTVLGMMADTLTIYMPLAQNKGDVDKRFLGGYPEWPALDKLADRWVVRIAFGALYTLFYMKFATHWSLYALLPMHYVMGPIHGAIVNWCGHKYGYRNYGCPDRSKNTLVFDVLTMGELFQNNHHKFGMAPNFAARWFEIDPTYQIMRVLAWVGIIDMTGAQTMRYPEREPLVPEAAE